MPEEGHQPSTNPKAPASWRPQFSLLALLLVVSAAAVAAFLLREEPRRLSVGEYLDHLDVRQQGKVDRTSLVKMYEDLIEQSSDSANLPLAMNRLARLYEIDSPNGEESGFVWDEDLAIVWYRKSFEESKEPVERANAGIGLARRLRIRGSISDLVEAKKVLDGLAPDSRINDFVELERLRIEISEKDFESAESRCRAILESMSATGGTKLVAAKLLVEAWPNSIGPDSEKKGWITDFALQFTSIPLLTDSADATIVSLNETGSDRRNGGESNRLDAPEWLGIRTDTGGELTPDLYDYMMCNETYIFIASTPNANQRMRGYLWKVNDIVQPSHDSVLIYRAPEPLVGQVEEALEISIELR